MQLGYKLNFTKFISPNEGLLCLESMLLATLTWCCRWFRRWRWCTRRILRLQRDRSCHRLQLLWMVLRTEHLLLMLCHTAMLGSSLHNLLLQLLWLLMQLLWNNIVSVCALDFLWHNIWSRTHHATVLWCHRLRCLSPMRSGSHGLRGHGLWGHRLRRYSLCWLLLLLLLVTLMLLL